jgi:hypothetical protein
MKNTVINKRILKKQRLLQFSEIKSLNCILVILIIMFCSSCFDSEEEIIWDLQSHPPMLVVDGAVTNQYKNQVIRLTFTSPYFSTDDPHPVHGATVSISEGSNNYNLTESSDHDGCYYSDVPFAGESGKKYDLNILLSEDIDGQREYSSSSIMPEGIDIDSIQCEIYDLPKEFQEDTEDKEKDTTILYVAYFGQEPESVGNCYLSKIYRNKLPLFSNIKEYPYNNDSERNGDYINVTACVKNISDQDSITFYLYSVPKDYYTYIDAISKIDQTGNIYSPQGPPANAVGNINGALGFFIATYVSTGKSKAFYMP